MADSLYAKPPSPPRAASHGRGGAGNISSKPAVIKEPGDLKTPTIKSSTYTTGRGGQGNMAQNDPSNPTLARLAQDVDTPAHHEKEAKGVYHWGRGGEGNMMAVGNNKGGPEGEGLKVRSGSQGKQRRGSISAAIEKGKEMLGLGGKGKGESAVADE